MREVIDPIFIQTVLKGVFSGLIRGIFFKAFSLVMIFLPVLIFAAWNFHHALQDMKKHGETKGNVEFYLEWYTGVGILAWILLFSVFFVCRFVQKIGGVDSRIYATMSVVKDRFALLSGMVFLLVLYLIFLFLVRAISPFLLTKFSMFDRAWLVDFAVNTVMFWGVACWLPMFGAMALIENNRNAGILRAGFAIIRGRRTSLLITAALLAVFFSGISLVLSWLPNFGAWIGVLALFFLMLLKAILMLEVGLVAFSCLHTEHRKIWASDVASDFD